ncbi:hypothetical protein J3Q64DRAFT_1773977 [Phycomyces blakesleeanus]|uniref:Uncharacterized protein n=1 Tax=Phycomyces blakesleeanus TaxID=4837 RepID=A0ABR3AK82_PHYBL
MHCPEDYIQYKSPIKLEGNQKFFSTIRAADWSFENYFHKTHLEVDKSNIKNCDRISKDYIKDLESVSRRGIPIGMYMYVNNLLLDRQFDTYRPSVKNQNEVVSSLGGEKKDQLGTK